MDLSAAVCTVVSSNIGSAPTCDVCAHKWQCPNPTIHELAGYCPDCDNWAEILEDHIEQCAVRCIARWHMTSKATLLRVSS